MGEKALSRMTVEAYLKYEAGSETRHEYHNGEIFAMAGGTVNHSTLGTNILTELNLLGRKKGCITFNGDMKIRIEVSNRYVYPEASLVCGNIETSVHDDHSITNPILVAEVLSDTSEAYDRGTKFRLYQKLESFHEYILIDQHRPAVTVFFKKDEKVWEMQEILGLEGTIPIQSLEAEISMADLYRNARDLKGPLEE